MAYRHSFCGESYTVAVGDKSVPVDVIVRDDCFRNFYEAALRDAFVSAEGWRVLTPEWLAILKCRTQQRPIGFIVAAQSPCVG